MALLEHAEQLLQHLLALAFKVLHQHRNLLLSWCPTRLDRVYCGLMPHFLRPLQGGTGTQNFWPVPWPAAAHLYRLPVQLEPLHWASVMAVDSKELLLVKTKHLECSPGL